MNLTALLDRILFHRLGDSSEAGLLLTSLPWPREAPVSVRLDGRETGVLPMGRWPNTSHPRRLLLMADGAASAPEQISLQLGGPSSSEEKPLACMELFEECEHPFYAWERHLLRMRLGSRSVGIAMGLRTHGEIHWWEACGLTVKQTHSSFTEVEMAGSIPLRIMTPEEFQEQHGYHNEYLHKHNWLSGHLYVRMHANGVCEVYAHHINSKFVDEGVDLDDAVPVIGFTVENDDPAIAELSGNWRGDRKEICLGGVRMDVAEIARLARPEQPGKIEQVGRFLVLQPYEGAELYGGICPETLTGDPFISHSEERVFPKGMARTLRFSLSLSDRSPRVVRYLAPAWWYGLCEEFLPESLLPVSNVYDREFDRARNWVHEHIVMEGFEDGSVPRGIRTPHPAKGRLRNEPGWEGEICYGQFLSAWRSGDVKDYNSAMRSAYHFTDIAIDHACKLVRMHGYKPNAISLPMNRVQGTFVAYLETGDPYLYEAAQAVTANAHWQHKNSWPRMTVGRDACYIRSAVLLYRYTGEDFFRKIAYEGTQHVAHSQRANGSFGDQGGGAGIHQWSGYVTKPWMGLLALNGVLDYLELFPNEKSLQLAVRKFADWLMRERWTCKGLKVWSYQHDYRGGRDFFNPLDGKRIPLPTPAPWHHFSFARLMAYCTLTFGDPSYLEAWAESFELYEDDQGDHSSSAIFQFVPWLQAKIWNARLTPKGIKFNPIQFGKFTPPEAWVLVPEGRVALHLIESTSCELSEAFGLETEIAEPLSDPELSAWTPVDLENQKLQVG